MRFPQSGLLEGFTRVDDAARQGNLPRVAQAIGPYCQDDVCGVTIRKEPSPGFFSSFRKHQQQPRRVPGSRRVEAGRPLSRRHRCHVSLSRRSRQLSFEASFQAGNRAVERHGRARSSVIPDRST